MPSWLEALLLGIVQGLTEFIPVSSSGHLVLVPYLAGWDKRSLAFDVMLHFGTLMAVFAYFRIELLAIIRGVLGVDRSAQGRFHRRLGWIIAAANVPVAIIGLTLGDRVEEAFASPLFASSMLLVTATLLLTAERLRDVRIRRTAVAADAGGGDERADAADLATTVMSDAAGQPGDQAWQGDWRAASSSHGTAAASVRREGFPIGVDPADPRGQTLAGLTLRQALIIGGFQCLALLPGVSRSGSTIASGVGAGLSREAATRFSFLLVIPVLLGATLKSMGDLAQTGSESALDIVLGMTAAGISGYLAIRFLVALVARARLTGFAIYCIGASAVGFIAWATLGPVSTV